MSPQMHFVDNQSQNDTKKVQTYKSNAAIDTIAGAAYGSLCAYIREYGSHHQSAHCEKLIASMMALHENHRSNENGEHAFEIDWKEKRNELYNIAGFFLWKHAVNHWKKQVAPGMNIPAKLFNHCRILSINIKYQDEERSHSSTSINKLIDVGARRDDMKTVLDCDKKSNGTRDLNGDSVSEEVRKSGNCDAEEFIRCKDSDIVAVTSPEEVVKNTQVIADDNFSKCASFSEYKFDEDKTPGDNTVVSYPKHQQNRYRHRRQHCDYFEAASKFSVKLLGRIHRITLETDNATSCRKRIKINNKVEKKVGDKQMKLSSESQKKVSDDADVTVLNRKEIKDCENEIGSAESDAESCTKKRIKRGDNIQDGKVTNKLAQKESKDTDEKEKDDNTEEQQSRATVQSKKQNKRKRKSTLKKEQAERARKLSAGKRQKANEKITKNLHHEKDNTKIDSQKTTSSVKEINGSNEVEIDRDTKIEDECKQKRNETLASDSTNSHSQNTLSNEEKTSLLALSNATLKEVSRNDISSTSCSEHERSKETKKDTNSAIDESKTLNLSV